jgi:PTS system cellobiose-specific IIB component
VGDETVAMPPWRVVMVCAGGMSSSLVETHIRRAAEAAGLPIELRSMSVYEAQSLDFAAHPADAVLVAPQVRFLRKGLAARLEPLGVLVLPIEPVDFGMADGEAILGKLMDAMQSAGERRVEG